jgi:thiosulfate reductase cytochrome b subunit
VTLEVASADCNPKNRTVYALVMLLFFTLIMTGLYMVGAEKG